MKVEYINTIKKYFKQFNNQINGMKLKKWLAINSEIYNDLLNDLKNCQSFSNIGSLVYCIIHDIDPNGFKCKACGKPLKIIHITKPQKYCSQICAMNDQDLQNKRRQTIAQDSNYYKIRQEKTTKTCLERYGSKTPAESDIVKQHMKEAFSKDPDIWKKRGEKSKQTCLERYGVENPSSTKEVRKKVIKSNMEKFGVDNPNKLLEIQEKIKNTCLKKYGVDCQFKRKEVIEYSLKKSWNKILQWGDWVIPLFTFKDYTGYNKNQEYKWKCVKCGNEFIQHLYHTKISKLSTFIPRCLKCYPIKVGSYKEIELQNFCKQYLKIIENDRNLIKPQELDIVIPEKKVAIEFNGIYWHSDKRKQDSNYHLNKTIACEEQGYKLIHIWEYDWINPLKQNILKEKIKAILGIDQEKIYARKCIIKEISAKEKNEFLNLYHIQGEDKSKIKLGLFYNDELVGVMTFGKPRFNKKYEWELIRYATKSGLQVLGGAGKLLSYFEKNYKSKNIITYADRSYSQGNMYKKIGFNLNKVTDPGYVWIKGNEIYTRYQCQKHKLKDILGEKFNKDLSENENMYLNGYIKIYDCGNLVFRKDC